MLHPKKLAGFGFAISLFTVMLVAFTFFIAITTPPLSGPLCEGACFKYPYRNIVSRFPDDYYWMFPAMVVSILFNILLVIVHHYADYTKKVFCHLALVFGVTASSILLIDYALQVSIVQPSLLSGETEGIALWTQYNPHGIFIVLEEIGYFLMTTAMVFLAPVFTLKVWLEKAIRVTCISGFTISVLSFALISAFHGILREYYFEIAIISVAWLQLILFAILMSFHFRQSVK